MRKHANKTKGPTASASQNNNPKKGAVVPFVLSYYSIHLWELGVPVLVFCFLTGRQKLDKTSGPRLDRCV